VRIIILNRKLETSIAPTRAKLLEPAFVYVQEKELQ